MNISLQPRPKVPPIGFFQPISTDPKDMMTDVEYLLGILKKLNEVIIQVNKNTEWIDTYNDKIEEIEAKVNELSAEMERFEQETIDYVNQEFYQIRNELLGMIAAALNQANAYTDAIAAQLREEIQEISLGDITLYDPTTGILSPLQVVVDNLYNSSRDNALTATEYDALDLTATDYDAYQLTAYDYDKNGKTLLV